MQRWTISCQAQGTPHLSAACQILQLRLTKASRKLSVEEEQFEHCLVESVVFQSSILALFQGPNTVCSPFLFEQLTKVASRKQYNGHPDWTKSPLLGNRPSLFRLIYEINNLRSSSPNTPYVTDLVQRLTEEDLVIEAQAPSADGEEKNLCRCNELRLYSTAARIVLMKSLDPSLQATDPIVQCLVARGLDLLRTWPSGDRFDQYFCWPLCIFGCAVLTRNDMELIRYKLEEIWYTSHCGDARRVKSLLERVWRRESRNTENYSAARGISDRSSPFDTLLHTTGLFNLL